jgi:CheY-like chemotaxis protein
MTSARVLIVDDEAQIRRALRTGLTGHGFAVEVAEDGETALTAVAAHPPDVIVLDLVMPGIDGFEVLRQLRAWSRVPVLVLSAHGEEHDKVEALDLGADDYLTKPFGMAELLARLRAVLRRAGAPQEKRRGDSSHPDRVRPAAGPRQQCRQGHHPSPVAGAGLGWVCGREHPATAGLHQLSPPQARGGSGASRSHPDRAGGRLPAQGRSVHRNGCDTLNGQGLFAGGQSWE